MYHIKNEYVGVTISKESGTLCEYIADNTLYVLGETKFNFWRALTDNDLGWKVDKVMKVWKNEGNNYKLKSIKSTETDSCIIIESEYLFIATKSEAVLRYSVFPSGAIKADFEIEIPKSAPNIPRIGMQFIINNDFINIYWYGRGEHENYFDRKTSAPIGLYQSTVDQWVTPYVRPQENANRCDIRRITFSDNKNQSGY